MLSCGLTRVAWVETRKARAAFQLGRAILRSAIGNVRIRSSSFGSGVIR